MYNNCKIINPKNSHKFTIILLHGMYSDYNTFNDFLSFFKNNFNNIYNYIKFIIPNSPVITIHSRFPYETNINSWYDYFTFNDGLCKLDEIGVTEFNLQCERIANIIQQERNIIKNGKNIYLCGVSQGGTLTFNILNYINFTIGGILVINSIYMDKYTQLNKKFNKIPIYIYSLTKDEIYPFKFQKLCYNKLKKKGFKLNWYINKINSHCDENPDQYHFIINSFFKIN